jgi:ABC-type enterochelin transport system substrate-binding protein
MKILILFLSILLFSACGNSENKTDAKSDSTKTKKDSVKTEPEKKTDTSSKASKDTSDVKITPETVKEEP